MEQAIMTLTETYEHLIRNYREHPPQLSHISSHALSVLEINFDAIAYNYLCLKNKFQGQHCGAVVKCDAYGVGAVLVSHKLYAHGCRHFFVTTIEEGIQLRQSGLPNDAHIILFSGVLPSTEDIFVEYSLTPIILDLEQLKRWQAYARQTDRKLPTYLHIDTGLNRTGICTEEWNILRQNLEWFDPLDLQCIMTHLACSPMSQNPFNKTQLDRFEQVCTELPPAMKSIASTEGVYLGEPYHYDVARIGLGLYGFNVSGADLVPSLRFWARVLQIHRVEAGESVGYGCAYVFEKPGKVIILSAGYYHGWLRSLTNTGEIYIAGHKARMVGSVSMDLCTVDVSDIPDSDLVLYGWVELSGQHVPMRQMAKAAGTITTEMVTFLTRNTNRLYVGAPEGV